jgi:hypothetical protein
MQKVAMGCWPESAEDKVDLQLRRSVTSFSVPRELLWWPESAENEVYLQLWAGWLSVAAAL